ncbi:MAG: FHA domain-containing protein [Oscillospiraceae bacterium]|nr:FHA domain-containing protein [Oscillospiraceae bacterium]
MTELYVKNNYGAKLVIMEGSNITAFPLDGRSEWPLGRYTGPATAESMVAIHSPIVSQRHGLLRKVDDTWYYINNPANTNGTLYNGIKITAPAGMAGKVRLYDGDILRIDSEGIQSNPNAVLMMYTTAPVEGHWARYSIAGKESVLIGRSPACDVVQSLPYLSGKHAQITWRDGAYYLSDCGSKAGTYINHQQVTKPVRLRDKDCFNLADRVFFLVGSDLHYMTGEAAAPRYTQTSDKPVALRADIRSKRVKDNSGSGTRELLRDIHLEIRQGTLVAMLGTAGAGKTTLMNCLNGMDLQGVEGSVIYRNVDLMRNFDQMKSLIGSVPQQKTFHRTFTPEMEFRFAARKRLPGDTSKQEIEDRVDKTLKMLSIEGVRKSQNCKLSGGEQTRVNVGIELVADRDLLCLDEPDQGLSPNYKHELFQILQKLAHESGKTMLCIIHDVSEIDMFDQVIFLAKKDRVGRLAYSGRPQDVKSTFGVDIRELYALLDKDPGKYVR